MLHTIIVLFIDLGFVLCGYILGRLSTNIKKSKAELIITDNQITKLNIDLDAVMQHKYVVLKVTKLRN